MCSAAAVLPVVDAETFATVSAGFFGHVGAHSAGSDEELLNFVGRYVMYRPDMRPTSADPVEPNGLVGASVVRVSRAGAALSIEAIKDIKRSELSPPHKQRNFGAFFRREDRFMFLMRGDASDSFNVGVVTRRGAFGDSEWFRGRLFVTRDLAIYPIVRFI
jgi:hypothetical protein